jgi:predicted RNA binding protein YcfA (HicA-like mRNA interferase family)
MSQWPSAKARIVLAALETLEKIGWAEKRRRGSHRVLAKPGWPDFVFAFHDRDEIGPAMMARIARRTGLKPDEV